MRVYPAIDLFEGKVVRLEQGDFNRQTVYSEDPAAFAQKWEKEGAEWLHVVDLEGAKTGILKNRDSLRKIRRSVKAKIQFGGGLRRLEDIEAILAEGIDRVILGTKALEPEFFDKAVARFGGRMAVGLDIKDGLVQTQGWLQAAQADLDSAVERFNNSPLEMLIYTDIKKDGMLEGPNFEALGRVLARAKARVILSGGVGKLRDLEACRKIDQKNFEGVIVGKALYESKFSLADALAVTKS